MRAGARGISRAQSTFTILPLPILPESDVDEGEPLDRKVAASAMTSVTMSATVTIQTVFREAMSRCVLSLLSLSLPRRILLPSSSKTWIPQHVNQIRAVGNSRNVCSKARFSSAFTCSPRRGTWLPC